MVKKYLAIWSVSAFAPKKIVYISCNVETQARDLKLFHHRGQVHPAGGYVLAYGACGMRGADDKGVMMILKKAE